MPIYTFQCQAPKCGKIFEEIMTLSESNPKKCRICKRGKVIKIISLPAKPYVAGDPRDQIKEMKRDAKRIAQKIVRGDERAIADVYGDDVANGRKAPPVPLPKTLDSLKGKGKIKRSKQ